MDYRDAPDVTVHNQSLASDQPEALVWPENSGLWDYSLSFMAEGSDAAWKINSLWDLVAMQIAEWWLPSLF